MNKRTFFSAAIGGSLAILGIATIGSVVQSKTNQGKPKEKSNTNSKGSLTSPRLISMTEIKDLDRNPAQVTPIKMSEGDWDKHLDESAYHVLRKEGTERAGTSPLNKEKRQGQYVCAGCGLALFNSDTKYESGTGWPSFFQPIEGRLGTKTDFKIGYPRKEYHCARCGGHQGHVFKDGPKPTGLRYCNNGIALAFIPDEALS